MSPIYLNPQTSSPIPFLELKGDQQHNNFLVFGHVQDHDLATSSNNSCLSYNNSHNSQEMLSFDYSRNAYSKVEKLVVSHEKQSDLSQPYTSWLQSTVGDNNGFSYDYSFHLQGVEKIATDDDDDVRNNKNHDNDNDDDDVHDHHHDNKYSKKWKPSKVRIMQKMMTSSFKNSGNNTKQQQLDHHIPKQQRQNNGDGIRVCSDCHTTTTPLWRSGPQGPKSLCNACGIRQRKARRAAMAAASFGNDAAAMATTPVSSPRVEARKLANKAQDQIIKQERGLQYHDKSHTLPIKKRSKLIDDARNNNYTQNSYNSNNYNNNDDEKKGYYEEEMAMSTNKDYYAKPNNPKRGSFPRDEEEGAILLMALSCGLACSS